MLLPCGCDAMAKACNGFLWFLLVEVMRRNGGALVCDFPHQAPPNANYLLELLFLKK